jgi:3' terminal RNA ribose 2'-O-methyltransferase Hen1
LLYKNPANLQSFELTFGKAYVFYPEATAERCSVSLLLDIDPVNLVRGGNKESGAGGQFDQYVNDRPYVASSFMSVAIAEVFGSALSGKSRERPELVNTPLPLQLTLSALPCRDGTDLLARLFKPLGYTIEATRHALDEVFPDWGESPYYTVSLSATCTLQNLLSHVYVLIPVLDNNKHYFIGEEEVAKLLRHGGDWLAKHPEKNFIAKRYLKHRRQLSDLALERLADEDDTDPQKKHK